MGNLEKITEIHWIHFWRRAMFSLLKGLTSRRYDIISCEQSSSRASPGVFVFQFSLWQSIVNMAFLQTLMEIYIELCIYTLFLFLWCLLFSYCIFCLVCLFWLFTVLRCGRQDMIAKNNSTKTIQRLREEMEFQGVQSPAAMREDWRY